MQPGDNEINDPLNQEQPVKYAGVIVSHNYPEVPESRSSAFLHQMPEGAYITFDIVIPNHQGFSNSQKVSVEVSESRNIIFDEEVSSPFSIKQTGSSSIPLLTDRDSATRKYPVFSLTFAGI